MTIKTIQQRFTVSYDFPVIFTRDVFNLDNLILQKVVNGSGERPGRVLIVVDSNVAEAIPGLFERIEKYGARHRESIQFVDSPFVIRGGEICKKEPVEIERIHSLIERHHLCRHSFVLAIGGGAVLDAAGYAAATAHRGLRLIRMPTTTLAQNDAGVGVKNSVNAFGRKNFLGTFSPPYAVINDLDFMLTLPERELRAGIAEAIKVALIKDRVFFEFLYRERRKLASFVVDVMEKMVIRCAELHLEHIRTSGDPFEYGTSRPLDFGHWSAHKIEEVSKGEVRHGEAVAIGVAIDSIYSYYKGLIDETGLEMILTLLEETGFNLCHWATGWMDVNAALMEFQEHLGGELTITLLNGLGGKVEVHEMDTGLIKKCINYLEDRRNGKWRSDGRSEVGKRAAGYIFS